MTTAFFGMLVVLLAPLLAIAGLVLVQRLVPRSLREAHNTPIGMIYAALYVMFGVIVGFSAYLVLNKHNTVQNTVENEAGNVEEIYWLAEQFPQPERDRVQELAASYARVVVDEEWPLMRQSQPSPRAEALSDELRSSIDASTDVQQSLYAQALERIHDLNEYRELRMLNLREGIPPIL